MYNEYNNYYLINAVSEWHKIQLLKTSGLSFVLYDWDIHYDWQGNLSFYLQSAVKFQ